MHHIQPLLLTLALLAPACRATTPIAHDAQQRSMFGTETEPLTDDWKDWTPSKAISTPTELAEQATAFDYWQVTDHTVKEDAWAALFGVLGEVRRSAPSDYDPTLRMLMTVLEPASSNGETRLDVTFFAAKPGTAQPWEGVSWRLWRELPSGAAPSVSVWLRRFSGQPDAASEAMLWFFSGVEEANSLTMRLDPKQAASLGENISLQTSSPIDAEGRLLRGILLDTFWKPVTDRAYLESSVARREETIETPSQQPTASGLTLADRDIEQVFSDSVFAPRLTLFPAKHAD